MSGAWLEVAAPGAMICAALLFLVHAGLTLALIAAAGLSRVALRLMSGDSDSRQSFLEELKDPASSYSTAAALMRQLCLMSGVVLVLFGARAAGVEWTAALGLALGAWLAALILGSGLAGLVAVWNPRGSLRGTAFLVRASRALLLPLVHPLGRILERIDRWQNEREEDRDEEEEEVEAFIEVGEREGILEKSESEMMRGIVDLDETRVREIMTPRTDIIALPVDSTVAEARRILLEAGHSRLPVYRDNIDNVVGVLHERDLLRAWEEDRGEDGISDFVREAMFVQESLSVATLLTEMRVKARMALVFDEFGGLAGMATLEDVLEEIVGDIRDEHDDEEVLVHQEPDGSWTINASAHVEELEQRFGVDFDDRDFDTVGGLVVTGFGRVPAVGESMEICGLHFDVIAADRRRIHVVRVRPCAPSSGAQTG